MIKIFCVGVLCLLLISCGFQSPIAPTSDNVMIINISTTSDWCLYQGLADKPNYYISGSDPVLVTPVNSTPYYLPYPEHSQPVYSLYPYISIGFSISKDLKTHFNTTTYLNLDKVGGSNFDGIGAEVVDVGVGYNVNDIIEKPTFGYSNSSIIQKHHGYVLRFRKSYDQQDTTLAYTYVKFYVVDWIKDGGIAGATIQLQNPFN
jgi:hypothetical protein